MEDSTVAANTQNGIYPVIIKPEDEVQQMINSKINNKNAIIVKEDVQAQQDKIKMYESTLTSWLKVKRISNVILLIVGLSLPIGSIILGILIDINILPNSTATEIMDVIGFIGCTILALIINVVLNKKIIKYNTIINDIQTCINKVFVYWNQAIKDGLISDSELTNFNNIFNTTNQEVTTELATPTIDSNTLTEIKNTIISLFDKIK